MKLRVPVFAFLAAGLLVAEEKPKLSQLDPFAQGDEYTKALERHTGPVYVAELPTAALTEAFREPLLSGAKFEGREIHRFTIFPAFAKPMTFRLEVTDQSNGVIHVKRLSGKGGYDVGTVELSSSVTSKGQVFTDLLGKLRAPRAHKPYGKLTKEHVEHLWGLDGSNWFLECRRGKDYSLTHVWSARSLSGTKKMLTEGGSKVYRQIDPEPFVLACVGLAQAAGFQLGRHCDALEPIKREQAAAGDPVKPAN